MNLQIANEIRRQIGQKALFMLGAINFVGTENSLIFKIKGSKKYNRIEVKLNSLDLYDIIFSNLRIGKINRTESVNDIYVDMLHKTIEEKTGLYTSL